MWREIEKDKQREKAERERERKKQLVRETSAIGWKCGKKGK